MDITKRFDRILQIFFFLQSKSVIKLDELTSRFQVSERTIYRDLKSLEKAGVPILNEPNIGYSIMEGFRAQPIRFSEEEMLSLFVAEKFMQKNETKLINKYFENALIKIKNAYRLHQKEQTNLLDNHLVIQTSRKNFEYPSEILDTLLKAILQKKQIEIDYIKSNETKKEKRILEAIGIFYQSEYWYMYAYCHLRKDYRQFRLDRIKKISLTHDMFEYAHPTLEELRELSKQQFHTKILVRVDKKMAHYMHWDRDKYGFISEKEKEDGIYMKFEYNGVPYYFARWIMYYIDIAEILTPENVRNEIYSILQKANHLYYK